MGSAQFAANRREFRKCHISKLWFPHAEIAEAEGQTAVGIEFRQEPGALCVGREELDDGFEVECVVAFVHLGALRAAVGEKFLLGSVAGPHPAGQPKGCSKRLLPF